ncbi:MAG: NAD(P)H-dependent oxidoreductase subunit E [Evtepia gabavorous]
MGCRGWWNHRGRQFTFEIARCIGACGLAPAMMVDDEVYKLGYTCKAQRNFGSV